MNRLIIVLIYLISTYYSISAQDIESIKKSKPFAVKGSVSGNLSTVNSGRYDKDQNATFYSIALNPTFKIYGVDIPLSIVYSNRKTVFQHPFRRTGASIKYKWIVGHVGHRNLNFSDYTLAGRSIFGYGLELNPGKFRFGIMTGKVNNASTVNSDLVDNGIRPSYDRKLLAVKLGFGKPTNYVDFNFLKGSDKYTTQEVDTNRVARTYPEDNVVFAIHTLQQMFKIVDWEIDAAACFLTRNKTSDNLEVDFFAKNFISNLMVTNISSQLTYAYKSRIGLNFGNFNVDLNYRKVMPDFKSMGSFYFNTDIQEYTINPSLNILQGKAQVSGMFGKSNNNLTKRRIQTSDRILLGGFISLNIIKNTNINFNYSNNKVELINALEDRLLDSLNLAQSYNSMSGSIVWTQSKSNGSFSLRTGGDFNTFDILSTYDPESKLSYNNKATSFYGGFAQKWRNQKLSVGSNLVYNINKNPNSTIQRIGININASKSLFNSKLTPRTTLSWSKNSFNGQGDGSTFRISGNMVYNITKKQNVGFNIDFINRSFKAQNKDSFSDIRTNLRYVYSF